jgi:serine/threonine protein kinase
MPFMQGGDLSQSLVASAVGMPCCLVQRYFRHVCEGLLHLKHCGLAHG